MQGSLSMFFCPQRNHFVVPVAINTDFTDKCRDLLPVGLSQMFRCNSFCLGWLLTVP